MEQQSYREGSTLQWGVQAQINRSRDRSRCVDFFYLESNGIISVLFGNLISSINQVERMVKLHGFSFQSALRPVAEQSQRYVVFEEKSRWRSQFNVAEGQFLTNRSERKARKRRKVGIEF